MTAITGGITPYLQILGHAPDSNVVTALLALQTGDVKESVYRDPYAHYLNFHAGGTSFLFEEDGLCAIFFYLEPMHGFDAYHPVVPLIDGLEGRATFDQVRSALGDPYTFDEDDFDVYKVADRQFVHLEYDMDMQVMTVTLMPKLPREQ